MSLFTRIFKKHDKDTGNPYASPVVNSCSTCGHFNPEKPATCAAFPEGIPTIILVGLFNHQQPYDFNGVSDEGIHWVPKDGQ